MKTKQVRIRCKDVVSGRTAYWASPHSIEKVVFLSRPRKTRVELPFENTMRPVYCVRVKTYSGNQTLWLSSMGISHTNNYNRTFRKRKHAEAWRAQVNSSPGYWKYMAGRRFNHLGLYSAFFSSGVSTCRSYMEEMRKACQPDKFSLSFFDTEFVPDFPAPKNRLKKHFDPSALVEVARPTDALKDRMAKTVTGRLIKSRPAIQELPLSESGREARKTLYSYQQAMIAELFQQVVDEGFIQKGVGKTVGPDEMIIDPYSNDKE